MDKLPKTITRIGTDGFGRPVFQDEKGVLYCDVNMSDRFGGRPKFCTKYRNEYEGEPDIPMPDSWSPEINGSSSSD